MTATRQARSSLAPCSPPSRTLRAGCAGRLRQSLTAVPRGAATISGRDEETPLSRIFDHHQPALAVRLPVFPTAECAALK